VLLDKACLAGMLEGLLWWRETLLVRIGVVLKKRAGVSGWSGSDKAIVSATCARGVYC